MVQESKGVSTGVEAHTVIPSDFLASFSFCSFILMLYWSRNLSSRRNTFPGDSYACTELQLKTSLAPHPFEPTSKEGNTVLDAVTDPDNQGEVLHEEDKRDSV